LCICTDIEHGERIDPQIIELAHDADVLIHEAQYTPEELPRYKGWGHSGWAQAVEVAEKAQIRQVFITHHDPDHDDEFLSNVEQQCQVRSNFGQCPHASLSNINQATFIFRAYDGIITCQGADIFRRPAT